jgi:hypothetical protein
MSGTFTRNSQRQLSQLRIRPPITGPRIGPSAIGRLTAAMSRLLTRPPAARTASVCISGKISPAPKPCSTRKPIRAPSLHAAAHSAEASTNTSSAAIHTRRPPQRRSAQPVTGIVTAMATRKPVVTHWIRPVAEGSSTSSVWTASVTIVESRIAAIPPTISASSALLTCGDTVSSLVRVIVSPVIRVESISYDGTAPPYGKQTFLMLEP